jgi:hypothetical protein
LISRLAPILGGITIGMSTVPPRWTGIASCGVKIRKEDGSVDFFTNAEPCFFDADFWMFASRGGTIAPERANIAIAGIAKNNLGAFMVSKTPLRMEITEAEKRERLSHRP